MAFAARQLRFDLVGPPAEVVQRELNHDDEALAAARTLIDESSLEDLAADSRARIPSS